MFDVSYPYRSGCKHRSYCLSVASGRACAFDETKRNGYDEFGRAYVEYLADDPETGTSRGSRVLAYDPYSGNLSGTRSAIR